MRERFRRERHVAKITRSDLSTCAQVECAGVHAADGEGKVVGVCVDLEVGLGRETEVRRGTHELDGNTFVEVPSGFL